MTGVWSALGYDETALSIARTLSESDEIVVIQGPPGIGKSWLAKGVGALWTDAGGATVVAEGDRIRSDVSLYPLGFALAGLSSSWRAAVPPALAAARAGEKLVGTGGIVTGTVQTLLKLRPKARKARQVYLGEHEQQVLFELERLAAGRPLLMIADNIHWWDRDSIEFLGRMRQQGMVTAFPFLSDMRVVAVQTPQPYQSVADPEALDGLLAPTSSQFFPLKRIERNGFEDVLVGLGAEEPPSKKICDAVFALTGGHLALARRCVSHIAAGESVSFLDAADSGDFIARLLTERLRSLGSLGTESIELLQIAAVIGLRFRRDEIVCAWNGDTFVTSRVLRHLRDESLLDLSEDTGAFVHDLYREHFLAMSSFDRVAVHERLGECLRQLSPGDYDHRAQNSIRAERPSEAAALAVQASLAQLRNGRPWDNISASALDALHAGGLTEVVELFKQATTFLEQDEYSECLRTIGRLPRALPEALLAEADYIRARCLMGTRSGEDRAVARALLAAWSGFEEREAELGIRLMMQHLFGLALLTDKSEGRALESKIKAILRSRARFDNSAEEAMYTLDRCAPSLYEPEVALIRVAEATAFFRPSSADSVVRRPVEYYLSLVNLAAEQVVNALFREALDTSAEIGELVDSFRSGTFPRLDFPMGTALIAEFRLGRLSAADAASSQRRIIAEHGVPGDPFYPMNALAVYLALDGQFEHAVEIYDDLLKTLTARQSPQPSMVYLLRSNRVMAQYLSGVREGLADEWRQLGSLVERIPYPVQRAYLRRHQLLVEVIERGRVFAPHDFDRCLLDSAGPEFGPMWEQMGRAFRLAEVEWWS